LVLAATLQKSFADAFGIKLKIFASSRPETRTKSFGRHLVTQSIKKNRNSTFDNIILLSSCPERKSTPGVWITRQNKKALVGLKIYHLFDKESF
jgi:hypothetical protein